MWRMPWASVCVASQASSAHDSLLAGPGVRIVEQVITLLQIYTDMAHLEISITVLSYLWKVMCYHFCLDVASVCVQSHCLTSQMLCAGLTSISM